MAHHSGPVDGRMPADFLSKFRQQVGPTMPEGRRWPEGRIDQSDDGEFHFGTKVIAGRVIVAFDRPVDWIGLTPEQARSFAMELQTKSLEARGIKG